VPPVKKKVSFRLDFENELENPSGKR